ncbi:hypothetical protein BDW22DRAFT_1335795 [Trametopsis cervina]|nr:hypothetical protein BDW22DRAFT_1335795 [Trametopsis cervina]
MSSRYAQSDYDWAEPRPDKPLIVKCNYEGVNKRITFASSRGCSYDLLRQRVEQCFSVPLTAYAISYTDDDGETTDIASESDLTEAIRYFNPGDDPPLSSAASILSGRSFGRGKITLRVKISVEYDGPSLSDTSSLASRDEFESRNGSEYSLSYSAPVQGEIDDDSVTVSSKDMGSKYDVYRARGGPRTIVSGPSREPLVQRPSATAANDWDTETVSSAPQSLSLNGSSLSAIEDRDEPTLDVPRAQSSLSLSPSPSPLATERGAAWLRDQNSRTLKSLLGSPRAPSQIDEFSLNDTNSVMSGELELQEGPQGKFYYAYMSSNSSNDASSIMYDAGWSAQDSADADEHEHRPTSRDLKWLQSQAELIKMHSGPPQPSSSNHIPPDIPPEVLKFLEHPLPIPLAPPRDPTDCSSCGKILETFRYVCAICGEKDPISHVAAIHSNGMDVFVKGKNKDSSPGSSTSDFAYPPPLPASVSPSVSSWTLLASDNGDPFHDRKDLNHGHHHKPLPALPNSSASPGSSPSSLTIPGIKSASGRSASSQGAGYELCYNCMESVGILHALESANAPGLSPVPSEWPPSPDQQKAFSVWKRTPAAKGQVRHHYIEKFWGPTGWADVEHDDHVNVKCSTCSSLTTDKRYKCALCHNFNLCKACYSQVHEIHPNDPFLLISGKPEKKFTSMSEPVLEHHPTPIPDETALTHPGVKCFHCMQDIVGARFHCVLCVSVSVDICSNCESAGLPGNLDSTDDGHNSSHIMLKIPYPLPEHELKSASREAKQKWSKDVQSVEEGATRPRRDSFISSYTRTVIGTASSSLTALPVTGATDDHGLPCRNCRKPIYGVRYQCAMCPSKPDGYSLCSNCEAHSYAIHDPMHVFFKLPRPVDHPIEYDFALLPILYNIPAGPPGGVYSRERPKGSGLPLVTLLEYLRDVVNTSAVCDRCMNRIAGEWFRCVYCAKDFCDSCESFDTHNDKHFFVVFKSVVRTFVLSLLLRYKLNGGLRLQINMSRFRYVHSYVVTARYAKLLANRRFAPLEDDTQLPPPIVPHAVYNR